MTKDKKNIAKNVATTKAPTRSMWMRSLAVLVALVGIGFTAIGVRLTTIQIVQADELRQAAMEQQLRDSTISPKRGTIYDTNMSVLAISYTVWTVILSPRDIKTQETANLIADELSVMLGEDRDKLYEKTQKTYSQYEIIKRKIEKSLCDELAAWVNEHKLAGVIRVIEDYKRDYPGGNHLSGVLGFTGTENTGLYGLEAYYESTLAGTPGRVITAKNAVGDDMSNKLKFEKTIGALDGKSLVLTIDSTVQYYAEKHLEQAVRDNLCRNRGAVIVMEVDTGAIVAMATKGDFNPNEPFVIADPSVKETVDLLSGDEQSAARTAALQYQWNNKPIFDFYEPGSVFKTFTSAAALEEINDQLLRETYVCNGSARIPGYDRSISCHYRNGHGSQTFVEALCHSCNPAFMKIGTMLGKDLFYKYYKAFGFTELTGIDMLSEQQPSKALYHTDKTLGPVELAIAAFGQRMKVTPIEMITALAAVANGGNLMQPYVVRQINNPDGTVYQKTTPTVRRQVISEETAAQLSAMLGEVVINGGGINAYLPGYRLGGKTGTSEKLDVTKYDNIAGQKKPVVASFGGIAPFDNPKYAILVMLDEPNCSVTFGGTIAAPLAKNIMAEALPYLGVEPIYTEKERAERELPTPNVTGKSVESAQVTLRNANANLTFKRVGDGPTVLRQVPESGKTIPYNGIVVLYTTEDELDKTTTVPDFTGKSLSQANLLAAEWNLNLLISGKGLDSGAATAASQGLAPGTKVPPGTAIKVTFVHSSTD